MKTEVDIYRGYEIRFDTSNETFECDIDDSRSVKRSYAAIKGFIDEFIKENNEFKPFKIIPNPMEWHYNAQSAVVVGIRKDKAYQIELADGTKKKLSTYDENKFWLSTPTVIAELEKVKPVLDEIERLEGLVKAQISIRENMYKAINATTVKDFKKEYLSNL